MRVDAEGLRKVVSVLIVVIVGYASFIAMGPMTAEAPPSGTLNITWKSLAPITNTFQGDVNLTMLWLSLEAQGSDITLNSIEVDTYGLPTQGINRTFAWDDRNGDEDMSFGECVIAEDLVAPYLLPSNGSMVECTGLDQGQPVVIGQNQTRYFTIYLDLYFDPVQNYTDRDLRLCVNDLNSSASTVNGLPSCSRTIDINRRFFYDDMEHGQGNWTFTGGDDGGVYPDGLWHLSEGEEDCVNNIDNQSFFHSGNTSWWYGHRHNYTGSWQCDYYTNQTGAVWLSTRNWGTLRTPLIDARLGTSLALTVWRLVAHENWSGADSAQIFLDDGSGWVLLSDEWPTDGYWKKLVLNLSQYAGKQVRLDFRFDTIDEQNNNYMGWFVDDLALYGEVLEHDIAVTDLDLEDYVFLEPQNITATISNIGGKDESNVEVNLTQNGTLIDQKIIPFIASGNNTTVTFQWTPPGAAVYEICVNSTPVDMETVLWNNHQCRSVNATVYTFTKVAVLRSYGTQAQGPKDTWNHLNANWINYGLEPVEIDYTSLNIYPITYEAIKATEADVLVLSGSGYYVREPVGTELSPSETEAIERYVREGNGFVTIGTAFNHKISNNNALVNLVGIADQPYSRNLSFDIEVDSGCLSHPVFENVSNPFYNAFSFTMAPHSDHIWDSNDLDGGQICARSIGFDPRWGVPILTSAVVINKGAVMISIAADVMPNVDERQLLYNSFSWSRYVILDYDVRVSDLTAPRFVQPSFPANISSLVSNIGRQDLSTVDVDLKVDGFVVDTKTLMNFSHAERTYVNFSWIPVLEGVYQICVFADIIGMADEDPSNNEVCTVVEATDDIPIRVYVLDSWGTDFAPDAPWDDLNQNWSNYGSIRVHMDYTTFNKERITYQELVDSEADVLLISSSRSGNMLDPEGAGYYFTFQELKAIERYIEEGHGLIGTGLTLDSEKLREHGYVLGPVFGLMPGNMYYYTTGINNLAVINPWENHPLFNNIADNYVTGDGTTLTPGLYIQGTPPLFLDDKWFPLDWKPEHLAGGEYRAMSYPTENATVIAHSPGQYKSAYITNFVEKDSNTNDKQLLYNAMTWIHHETEADIGMFDLVVPNRVRPSPALQVGATLRNLAVREEDNGTRGIDVLLTQDGMIVDQTWIRSLGIGESIPVVLTWDPPDAPLPQTYNICMKAWPVNGETDTTNNEACKFVRVIEADMIVVGVLDSWGTDNASLAPWDDISANWSNYGPYPILIDYTTLDKENITLLDLVYSSADVLLISSSNSTMLPTAEFTTAEIAAIQMYTQTMNYGIVGTGLTLSTLYLPTNNLLAPLFGIDPSFSFTNTSGVVNYQKLQPSHTVFYQMPSPFSTASGISCTPGVSLPDPAGWIPALLLPGGEFLGNSTPEPSSGAVVSYSVGSHRGLYLSNSHEMSSSEDDEQILYNSMIWASGKTLYPVLPPNPPEDLWISIEGNQLRLDWTVVDPHFEVMFDIFRADAVDGFNFSNPHDRVATPPYLDALGTATDSNNYYYVVRAINITNLLTENNTNKVGKFYNRLSKGSNDISIPFSLKDTSVDTVFGSISNDIKEVAIYHSMTATWLRWFPGVGGAFTDVDNTMGIRVISKKNNVDFVTVGRVPERTSINLTIFMDQWFFVGYPNFKTNSLPDVLDDNGLSGLYVVVLYYDPTDRRTPWKWFDPQDPGGSPLQSLQTGKGYWMLLKGDGIWTVPGE